MVRDVVERVIPNPSAEDIKAIKRRRNRPAISSGAVPDTVEVYIEINAQTQQVRAIALGSTAVQTTDLLKEASEDESRALAAEPWERRLTMSSLPDAPTHCMYSRRRTALSRERQGPMRSGGQKGFIKVQRGDAAVKETTVANTVSGD